MGYPAITGLSHQSPMTSPSSKDPHQVQISRILRFIGVVIVIVLVLAWIPSSLASPLIFSQPDEQAIKPAIQFSPWDLVMSVAWSPDGRRLAVSAGDWLYVYDVSTLSRTGAFRVGALIHALAFSPDGFQLAAGSRDGMLRLWHTNEFQDDAVVEPTWTQIAHKKGVNTVVFSPDGSMVASGGNDAVARLWNVVDGAKQGEMIGGTYAVPVIDFNPDGRTLAIVNGDMIRLREVGSGRMTGSFWLDGWVYSLDYDRDGRRIVIGDTGNTLRLWETDQAFRTGSVEYPEPRLFRGHTGRAGHYSALIWSVRFSPDGGRIASAGGDGTVRVWDPSSGNLLATLSGHKAAVTSLSFSPGGDQLASGSLDGSVWIWDLP